MVRDVDMGPFTFNTIQVRDCNRNHPRRDCNRGHFRRDLFPTRSPFRLKVIRSEHGIGDVVCLTQDGKKEIVPYWNLLPGDRIP